MYEATRRYVSAVAQLLAERAGLDCDVPGEWEIRWVWPTEVEIQHGTTGEVWTETADEFRQEILFAKRWGAYYDRHLQSARGLPEYSAYAQDIRLDPVVSRQLDVPIGTALYPNLVTPTPDQIATLLVIRTLGTEDIPVFDEARFDHEYRRMREAFDDNYIRFQQVAPLVGFRSEVASLELEPGLWIDHLTDKERPEFIRLGEVYASEGFGMARSVPTHALRQTYELRKVVGGSPDAPRDGPESGPEGVRTSRFGYLMDEVPLALAAYKSGYCVCTDSMGYYDNWLVSGGGGGGRLPTVPPGQKSYHLTAEEADGFPEFWSRWKSDGAKRRKYLRQAAKRLLYASERPRDEDRLLDLMVAGEALFPGIVDKPSNTELSFRLSSYAAGFLGTTTEQRLSIFRQMRDAYNLRSQIVHGDTVDVAIVTEAVQQSEEHIRNGLHKALQLASRSPTGGKKIVDEDDLLFPDNAEVSCGQD